MQNENTALMERWFEQVWHQKREAAIEELTVPGFYCHGVGPEPMVGAEPFKAVHQSLLAAFDDLKFEFMHVFAEGDLVSGLCEFSMTRKNTGERVKCLGNVVLRVEDGKIAEGWNTFNFLDLVEQCGTAPCGSFSKMLADNAVD